MLSWNGVQTISPPGLLAVGLRPGDRIGIWSPNNAEAVITQSATGKAGLTLVTINPACRRAEFEYSLNKVGCKALITAASFKTSNDLNIPSELTPEIAACPPGHLVSARVPCLTTLIYIGADALGWPARSRGTGTDWGDAGQPWSDQRPVRQWHDRIAQRFFTQSPQPCEQRVFYPHVEIKIIDAEGLTVAPGETGDLGVLDAEG
jgi:aspartate 1-decarboxylase